MGIKVGDKVKGVNKDFSTHNEIGKITRTDFDREFPYLVDFPSQKSFPMLRSEITPISRKKIWI